MFYDRRYALNVFVCRKDANLAETWVCKKAEGDKGGGNEPKTEMSIFFVLKMYEFDVIKPK